LYESKNPIHYTSIEAYPLHIKELQKLNYSQRLNSESKISFSEFSAFSWEIEHSLSPLFSFVKNQILFQQFTATRQFDLIFYDAFGAHAQPELWEKKWIKKCHDMLNKGGVWVSFCAKGSVRRALQEVGFTVERLAGPPGKREMLRAIKP
jgi:tRNA U34 5-methylaminomethyl-2-thiouridine-forming methyltransferase MnmC